MIKVVLDTTTIVSGMISPHGTSYEVLEAARSRRVTLVTSAPLIAEVLRTLRRDRIRRKYRIGEDDVERLRELLERDTIPTVLTESVSGVATHPEDDLTLATALSARADFLVTWDLQLQRLGRFGDTTILNPGAFLVELDRRLGG